MHSVTKGNTLDYVEVIRTPNVSQILSPTNLHDVLVSHVFNTKRREEQFRRAITKTRHSTTLFDKFEEFLFSLRAVQVRTFARRLATSQVSRSERTEKLSNRPKKAPQIDGGAIIAVFSSGGQFVLTDRWTFANVNAHELQKSVPRDGCWLVVLFCKIMGCW